MPRIRIWRMGLLFGSLYELGIKRVSMCGRKYPGCLQSDWEYRLLKALYDKSWHDEKLDRSRVSHHMSIRYILAANVSDGNLSSSISSFYVVAKSSSTTRKPCFRGAGTNAGVKTSSQSCRLCIITCSNARTSIISLC